MEELSVHVNYASFFGLGVVLDGFAAIPRSAANRRRIPASKRTAELKWQTRIRFAEENFEALRRLGVFLPPMLPNRVRGSDDL